MIFLYITNLPFVIESEAWSQFDTSVCYGHPRLRWRFDQLEMYIKRWFSVPPVPLDDVNV